MKISSTIKAATLALAGLVLGHHQASGALVYTDGDIFVGIRVSNTSYVFDLGSVTQFNNAAPGSTLSFGSINTTGADLSALFGGTWYDLAGVSWGVFGADALSNNTLYASKARSDVNVQNTTLWPTLGTSQRNSTKTALQGAGGAFANASLTTSSTNTLQAGVQTSAAAGNGTYYSNVGTGATDFGSVSQWGTIETSNALGIDNTALDLIKVTGGPSSVVGKFTIDNTGVITFTAAVPEPSTYALLAISGVVFIVFLRRRRSLQA